MPIRRVRGDAANPPTQPPEGKYDVGYGKPPEASRFKKGCSGNPKGRPRHAKSLNTIVRELMLEKVPVRTTGGQRRVSRAEALVMKQLELASKGNMRALMQLLQLFQAAVPDHMSSAADTANLESTETDLAILAAIQAQLRAGGDDAINEGR